MTGPKRVRLWTSISTERLDARVLERIELVQDRANVVDSSLTAPQILRAMENPKLALRLGRALTYRCIECGGQVRAHATGKDGSTGHFEHAGRNQGCSLGDCFDGTKRPI